MKPYRPITLKAYLLILGVGGAAIFIVGIVATALDIPLWARAVMNLILGMAGGRIGYAWWKRRQGR